MTSYQLRDSDVRDLREQMAKDLWAHDFVSGGGVQAARRGFYAAERAVSRHAAAVAAQRQLEQEADDALRDLRGLAGGGHIGSRRL